MVKKLQINNKRNFEKFKKLGAITFMVLNNQWDKNTLKKNQKVSCDQNGKKKYQNLWNPAKAALTEFIAINSYVTKNNLT